MKNENRERKKEKEKEAMKPFRIALLVGLCLLGTSWQFHRSGNSDVNPELRLHSSDADLDLHLNLDSDLDSNSEPNANANANANANVRSEPIVSRQCSLKLDLSKSSHQGCLTRIFAHNRANLGPPNDKIRLIDCFLAGDQCEINCIFDIKKADLKERQLYTWNWTAGLKLRWNDDNQTHFKRNPLPMVRDGRNQTLVLQFALFIGGEENDHGKIHEDAAISDISMTLWAEDPSTGKVEWSLVQRKHQSIDKLPIPVCLEQLRDGPRHPNPFYLTGSTMINDKFYSSSGSTTVVRWKDQAQLVSQWVWYYLQNGFDHLTLYLDFDQAGFKGELEAALVQSLQAKKVTLIDCFIPQHHSFEFQQAMGTHSLYRYKAHTTWLGSMDIDEYFLPHIAKYPDLRQLLMASPYEPNHPAKNPSALRVSSHIYENRERAPTTRLWEITWTDGENAGRQKLLMRVALVDYFTIHFVTTARGGPSLTPDPDTELKIVHFKGFGDYDRKNDKERERRNARKNRPTTNIELHEDLAFAQFWEKLKQRN